MFCGFDAVWLALFCLFVVAVVALCVEDLGEEKMFVMSRTVESGSPNVQYSNG